MRCKIEVWSSTATVWMSTKYLLIKLAVNFFSIIWRQPCSSFFIKFHHLPSAAEQWSAGKMAERGSDARSYNLFPSYPVVCFEKKEMENEGEKREKRETNGPISFLKRCLSSSFIKRRRRILFDWLITRGIHHWPTYPHQFDTAILDNLLRMTKRSLLPWLLSDLFSIRKLIFNLKQMY